jgi:zinc finger protein
LNKMISNCPVCKIEGCLEIKTKIEEIPYFGEVMESTASCGECGYKHSDLICLEQKDPVKYTLKVDKNRMNVRVVKSQSATITIPELGLKVEPGPQSEGYVSNMEGVLNRFEKAVQTALSWAEDESSRKTAVEILEEIEKIKTGHKTITMVMEDPFGHSLIEHKDAWKRKLEEEEIKNLKTGFITFER